MSNTAFIFQVVAFRLFGSHIADPNGWINMYSNAILETVQECGIPSFNIRTTGQNINMSGETYILPFTPSSTVLDIIRNECIFFVFQTKDYAENFLSHFLKKINKFNASNSIPTLTPQQYNEIALVMQVVVDGFHQRKTLIFWGNPVFGIPYSASAPPTPPTPPTPPASLAEQLKECNENRDRILNTLDNLKFEIKQFKSKDPETLKQNIIKLENELKKIIEDAEQAQQQEEEQRKQEEEEEDRRKTEAYAEERRQNEMRQNKMRNKKNCASHGIEPTPCQSKADYKKQLLLFHTDRNRECAAEANTKFIGLQEVCKQFANIPDPDERDDEPVVNNTYFGGSKKNKKSKKGYKTNKKQTRHRKK